MSKYDNDLFIKIWNSEGIEGVIKEFKVTRRATISKAEELRKSGANLKKYQPIPQGYTEAKTEIDIEKEMGYGRYRKPQINNEDIEIEQEDFLEVKNEIGV